MEIYAATHNGFVIVKRDYSGWRAEHRGLVDHNVTSIIAREGVILAGTEDGIYRSWDYGRQWRPASEGLATRHVRWLAFHPDISDREYAGTEPAGIYRSLNGGDNWQEAWEVPEMRDQFGWFLPYSPEAGCVRGFAFHGRRAYAAVEVGAALRSDDAGDSWALAGGSDGQARFGRPAPEHVHSDVHSIAVHPSSADLVWAATGGGLYRSADGGDSWSCSYECYCRALWLDPDEPAHLIFGPATSVSRDGRLEESRDGGRSWRRLESGLETPWPRHMVERLTPIGDHLFAVLSNGELLSARIGEWRWELVYSVSGKVNAVTQMIS